MFAVPSFFGYNTTFVNTPVATAATGVGETSFTANWNAFSGASYYLLDVSLSSSFSSFVLQDTVTTATSYVVTGLTASTTYYYRIRAAINVDSDVAGFVSRVYTAGGTLSYTEVTATETLVADLKGYGIWTAMKAVYPMVGASAEACKQNLKSSSFTGSFSSGWTFSASGVNGNGVNAYFDTNVLPTTQLSISSAQISCYINSAVVSMGVAMGNNDLSCFLQPQSPTLYGSLATTTFLQPSVTINPAFYMVNRPSINSQKVIKNSTIIDTNTATGVSYSAAQNIFVGAYSPSSFNSSSRFAFASIGDGLTDTQAADLYTCVQTFNTTLSRQV